MAALKRKGISIRQWCDAQDAPCTRHHLYECFKREADPAGKAGRPMNAEIRAAIERFIKKWGA